MVPNNSFSAVGSDGNAHANWNVTDRNQDLRVGGLVFFLPLQLEWQLWPGAKNCKLERAIVQQLMPKCAPHNTIPGQSCPARQRCGFILTRFVANEVPEQWVTEEWLL